MDKRESGGPPGGVTQDLDADLIRTDLKKVLESPAFRGSKRSSDFLEFVVERALAQKWGDLKERTIAVEVFGRSPDADLTEDTIVRVGAREVRKRLAQYYVTPEAAHDPLRIDLSAGTYVPHFHMAPVSVPDVEPVVLETLPIPARGMRVRTPAFLVMGAVAALLAAGGIYMLGQRGTSEMTAFWKPMVGAGSTVLIGVAHPVIYQPSLEAWQRNTALFQGHPPNLQAPFEFPEKDVKGSEMMRVRDQFVGYGDLVSVGEVTSLLAAQGKQVRYRLATKMEVSDLRESPVVLIGAFTNRWTTELSQKMRFHFNWGDGMSPQIEDTVSHRVWSVTPGLSDASAIEDYFLVTRVVESTTGRPFLILAGLKQAGTEAAGYLVTTPTEIDRILRPLDPSWRSRNLQLVLHTRVVSNHPSEFELLAHYIW
jgi:hypothetical protein